MLKQLDVKVFVEGHTPRFEGPDAEVFKEMLERWKVVHYELGRDSVGADILKAIHKFAK